MAVELTAQPLSIEEIGDLKHYEGVVDTNLKGFVLAGEALAEIRDRALWRGEHRSFSDYLAHRWPQITRQQAYRLIDAAAVVANLSPMGDSVPMPTAERQTRAIAGETPEVQRAAWELAASRAPEGEAPTGRLVEEARDEVLGVSPLEDQDAAARAFLSGERARKAAAEAPASTKPEPVARGREEILKAAKELRQEEVREKKEARTAMHREVAAKNQVLDFKDQRFSVIEADCPWEHDNTGVNGAAEKHYPTMPTDEICQLPVERHATKDAVLFLWATNAMLDDAEEVMAAWGFEYKTSFVWIKSADEEDAELFEELEAVVDERHGTGWYNEQDHELLLLGVRGGNMTPVKRFSSVIVAPRGKHSEKPEKAYQIIEAMYPDAPRLGMFRRSARAGWTAWGNEVDDKSEVPDLAALA